jgi:hypothetical protein
VIDLQLLREELNSGYHPDSPATVTVLSYLLDRLESAEDALEFYANWRMWDENREFIRESGIVVKSTEALQDKGKFAKEHFKKYPNQEVL